MLSNGPKVSKLVNVADIPVHFLSHSFVRTKGTRRVRTITLTSALALLL